MVQVIFPSSVLKGEMISYWDYPSEEYEVVTEDGYILGVNRIPHGKIKSNNSALRPVVFLMHGFLTSASCWVSNLPSNSLAFILADAGYDVWMGNVRGNTYSRKHIHLSPESKEFWSFSFDEMAKYDLPALINFIVKQTGQEQIYYAAHSQGNIIAFIAFSTIPKLAQRIKTFFALAPGFYFRHIRSALRILLQLPTVLLETLFSGQEIFPKNILNQIAAAVCNHDPIDVICGKINFALFGFDPESLNMSRIDVYLSQNPGGTSLQNLLHYKQAYLEIKEVLRAYDFGSPAQNMKHYNQPIPPQYSVKNMKVRTAIWYGLHDSVTSPQDTESLLTQIPNLIYSKKLRTFNHIDFIFGSCSSPLQCEEHESETTMWNGLQDHIANPMGVQPLLAQIPHLI
ncbi:lipase member J-like [Tupaia chinensis]|uniref:lipase member J-like n=1 Tax=Tupaia chinensis TaxID=246437 RepID=UPI000FFC0431|nr:lipase member J-like [Tupaia chinensis]